MTEQLDAMQSTGRREIRFQRNVAEIAEAQAKNLKNTIALLTTKINPLPTEIPIILQEVQANPGKAKPSVDKILTVLRDVGSLAIRDATITRGELPKLPTTEHTNLEQELQIAFAEFEAMKEILTSEKYLKTKEGQEFVYLNAVKRNLKQNPLNLNRYSNVEEKTCPLADKVKEFKNAGWDIWERKFRKTALKPGEPTKIRGKLIAQIETRLKIFLQRKRNTELEIQKMSDKFVELTNKLKEAYEENNRIVNEINSKINQHKGIIDNDLRQAVATAQGIVRGSTNPNIEGPARYSNAQRILSQLQTVLSRLTQLDGVTDEIIKLKQTFVEKNEALKLARQKYESFTISIDTENEKLQALENVELEEAA